MMTNYAGKCLIEAVRKHECGENIEQEYNDDKGVFRLLCGVQRGRSLRDIIVHQTTARLEYSSDDTSYKKKDRLYIVIQGEYYSVEYLVLFVTIGVTALISKMEQYLESV